MLQICLVSLPCSFTLMTRSLALKNNVFQDQDHSQISSRVVWEVVAGKFSLLSISPGWQHSPEDRCTRRVVCLRLYIAKRPISNKSNFYTYTFTHLLIHKSFIVKQKYIKKKGTDTRIYKFGLKFRFNFLWTTYKYIILSGHQLLLYKIMKSTYWSEQCCLMVRAEIMSGSKFWLAHLLCGQGLVIQQPWGLLCLCFLICNIAPIYSIR